MRKKIIFPILVLTFLLIFSGCSKNKTEKLNIEKNPNNLVDPNLAAIVNGKKIYISEIEQEYIYYVQRETSQNKPEPDQIEEQKIKNTILEELISYEVNKLAIKKESIKVTEKEIIDEIDKVRQKMTPEKFAKYLLTENLTEEEFAKNIEDQLIQKKLVNKITKDLNISDKEKEKYFNKYLNDYRKKLKIKIYY